MKGLIILLWIIAFLNFLDIITPPVKSVISKKWYYIPGCNVVMYILKLIFERQKRNL